MKVTLTLNEEQAQAVQNALETYARIGMGQFGEVVNMYDCDATKRHAVESVCKAILVPQLNPSAYYSISSPQVPPKAQLCWDVYQTLRHRMSWHRAGNPDQRDWHTMGGVNYDDPMPVTGVPLPVVKVEYE